MAGGWPFSSWLEALLLLIALTPTSEEIQKLVAFENAFEILLDLITKEGALTLGTEVVEDCLSLLAHLLRFNVSNQSFFRETGCAKKVRHLLHESQQEPEDDEPLPQWTVDHRDKNIWGLLSIIQLFLIRGGMSTPANQNNFWQNGVTEEVLSIAFGQRFSVRVTSKVSCRPFFLFVWACNWHDRRHWQPVPISSVAIPLCRRDLVISKSCGGLTPAVMRLSMATPLNLYE